MDLIEFLRVQDNFKRHPWEIARAKIATFILNSHRSAARKIIDIGSGDAFIAGSVAEAFPSTSVTAVDINYSHEIIHRLNKQQPNLELKQTLEDVSNAEPIDAVLLMDVLEHLANPGEMLQSIRSKAVHEKTNFFITVPAFQSLFTEHDEILGHYKRYNRKQLKQLVTSNGFRVVHSGYFYCSLLPVRTIQKWTKADFNENGLFNWKQGKFITNLIANIFLTEFKFSYYLSRFGIHLPGLTCYCICRPLTS